MVSAPPDFIGERDTYMGNTIEHWGYLFIYIFGRTYVIFSLIFVFAPCSTPSQTSLNRILRFSDHYHITLEIELFTALNCFAGAVKTQKLMGAPFLFELVAVVS